MSWKERTLFRDFNHDKFSLLIRASDSVVSLHQNTNTKMPVPFKFSQLTGIGIKSEIIGKTEADIAKLRTWLAKTNDLVLGYFSYDTKNILENIASRHPDDIEFPLFHFFVPETVVIINGNKIECRSHADKIKIPFFQKSTNDRLNPKTVPINREQYLLTVQNLKDHIQQGDIYEVNYCVQHSIRNMEVDPYSLFEQLQSSSPAPFSCFVADKGKFLMSSSPERFMMKNGTKIVSQPIKGTNRKTADNAKQMQALRSDPKEVSENVMITDLVRNDLSKSAKKGSVLVEELCSIYPFQHVNQMISTVSAQLRDDVNPLDALLNAFPTGSMTGAPKFRAMELIEHYEDFSRGLYSGSVGYFTPELDFDFNVVIRSILYNKEKKVVTFPTGGAITTNSNPEKEYEECMLKAEAMRNVLRDYAK